jgi:hypothetical protein
MTHDTLDDQLDRSAPAHSRAAQIDLDAMIADARPEAPRSLRPRLLIAAGLTAILATGGTGIAIATDGFSWAPWAQDPIGAVQFTMASGFQCELRYAAWTGGSDPEYVGDINGILEDWYRNADVLAAARADLPAALEEVGPIFLDEGETVESLPPEEVEHREFVREWMAWDIAIGAAESEALSSHGIQPGDSRADFSERSSQIKCFDENNKPYEFGAGA